MAAREERVLSCDGLWSDRPLNDVGVDLDAAVGQEALESEAPGCGIADRLGEFGFAGQARQLLLPQMEEPRDNGGGLFLARFHPRLRILAADVGLDLPQPGHGGDGLRRQARALVDVKLVEPSLQAQLDSPMRSPA